MLIDIILLYQNRQPDLGLMKRIQQILGRKHRHNLHVCNASPLFPLCHGSPMFLLAVIQVVDFLYSKSPFSLGRRYMFFTLLLDWRVQFLVYNSVWIMWYLRSYYPALCLLSNVILALQCGFHSFFWRLVSFYTNSQVWKKIVYVDRLLQLFRYVPREQLTIPDFVFQLSNHSFFWS